ncbi:hypothetical protein ABEB36_012460 [Hypothenemus hampei]|uniref:F-box domain-containing protein n=1 Tax=Hypothenemus hampei TaxID=57062 RepID=A0ABD1EE00_HYPHA
MEKLKNRFKIRPIYSVPDFPEYAIWNRTIEMCEIVEWPEGKLHAQKPYSYRHADPLGAEHFINLHFLGPIRTANFKMHPSWEEANVVVRIWVTWMDYEKWIISRKWHLLYVASHHSNEGPSGGNYMECSELINTLRIEFNRSFPSYTLATAAIRTRMRPPFHLFCPFDNSVLLYDELQTLIYNVPAVPARRDPGVKSNGKNFTETYLPPEILYGIFERLDLHSLTRCAQVNKRWNSIASDSHFYRDVDLKMYWHKMNVNTLGKLKKRLLKVRKLDMSWCNELLIEHVFNNSIASILEKSKDTLTHLCLNQTHCVSNSVWHGILKCPNLEELRLRRINFHYVDDCLMSCCLNGITKLKILDVSMSCIKEYHLIEVLKNAPNLEHLVMDECSELKNLEPILTTVRDNTLKLKSWSSLLTFRNNQVDNSQMYEEFGQLIHLEQLNLGLCEPLPPYGGNCLKNIARNCEKLKRLELIHWRQLTDEELLPIITKCTLLFHLNLTNTSEISSLTLSMACENLPNLREICISNCRKISEEMIEYCKEKYQNIKIVRRKGY